MSTAFVLSGGGARGAFQAGVIKQLLDRGIVPDAVYGTSVGAVNAAGYVFSGEDNLLEMWKNITKVGDLFKRQWISSLFNKGYYTLDPLRTLLSNLYEPRQALRCPATVFAVDLFTGKTVFETSHDIRHFIEMTAASASIPALVVPSMDRYVDGGVREMIPLNSALSAGHENVYVITTEGYDFSSKGYKLKWPYKTNILARSADLIMHERTINDLQSAVCISHKFKNLKIFMPESLPLGMMDFESARIKKAIELGLKAKEVNIEDVISENPFMVDADHHL